MGCVFRLLARSMVAEQVHMQELPRLKDRKAFGRGVRFTRTPKRSTRRRFLLEPFFSPSRAFKPSVAFAVQFVRSRIRYRPALKAIYTMYAPRSSKLLLMEMKHCHSQLLTAIRLHSHRTSKCRHKITTKAALLNTHHNRKSILCNSMDVSR